MNGSSLRYEVIEDPSSFDNGENARMAEEWTSLAASACLGCDKEQAGVRSAWQLFFGNPEEQPCCFDRLVSVRNEAGQLVSFSAVRRLTVESRPVLYWSFAMTHPHYQRSTVTACSWTHMLNPDYLRKFAGGYIAARTANPLVYRLAQFKVAASAKRAGLLAQLYPEIVSPTANRQIPAHIRQVGQALVPPGDGKPRLDEDTFVIKEAFRRYGTLYDDYSFYSRDPVVGSYFRDNILFRTRDGMLLLWELAPPADQ